MALLKIIRILAWGTLGVMGLLGVTLLLGWWQVAGPGSRFAPNVGQTQRLPDIGGPFTLISHIGKAVTHKDFLGRPALVFFGFTHCPEVCPTALSEITNRLQALGRSADRLQILFITVDPERDTPEQLAMYLEAFDSRIVGLSGTQDQVNQAIQAYGVYARRIPLEGGSYSVDHTASVFMMDSAGRFIGSIDYHENDETAIRKMQRLAGL